MRRFLTFLPIALLASSAHAQGKQADERFFDAFLPVMIAVGVLIVVFVIVVNVVANRRRRANLAAGFAFDPARGLGVGPTMPPRTVTKRTTTTSADGSVTVTVVEETTSSGGSPFGSVNGVVDPELFTDGLGPNLEREILDEVRDAFRRIDSDRKPQ